MKPASWHLPQLNWQEIDQIAARRNVVVDSRKVRPGDVFLAFRGEFSDGRAYIGHAIDAGAAAVLWEADAFYWNPDWQVPNIAIPNLRAQAGIVAAHLYGNPSHEMCAIGVTGTNGKTSITHWLIQALSASGRQGVLIGTLGNGFLRQLTPTSLTTPDAATLQTLLAQYLQQGATHLAMEVSSHALEQGRVHGVEFDVAVLTNLTRDHLDYHGSMQQYGEAKRKLFDWENLKAAVINADDAFGSQLLKTVRAPTVLSYGLTQGDVRAKHAQTSLAGIKATVTTPWGEAELASKVIGHFNLYNILATLTSLLVTGIPLADAARVLRDIEPAAGRMQRVGGGEKPLVIVDYAHTPAALEKALITLRETMPAEGKLYCVFGCGGDRDRGKRPLMAEIATTLADMTVVTSDNPRTEKPACIINDIRAGLRAGSHYQIEEDRAGAIALAVSEAKVHDVVLIAGKGHETYQEVCGVRQHFDDVEVAQNQLAVWRPI